MTKLGGEELEHGVRVVVLALVFSFKRCNDQVKGPEVSQVTH